MVTVHSRPWGRNIACPGPALTCACSVAARFQPCLTRMMAGWSMWKCRNCPVEACRIEQCTAMSGSARVERRVLSESLCMDRSS
ncbi:hypothetical protein D3C87_1911910 [compost metagenome]